MSHSCYPQLVCCVFLKCKPTEAQRKMEETVKLGNLKVKFLFYFLSCRKKRVKSTKKPHINVIDSDSHSHSVAAINFCCLRSQKWVEYYLLIRGGNQRHRERERKQQLWVFRWKPCILGWSNMAGHFSFSEKKSLSHMAPLGNEFPSNDTSPP